MSKAVEGGRRAIRSAFFSVFVIAAAATYAAKADEQAPFQGYLARAQEGEPYAMEMLGAAYEQGSMGATQNFQQAAKWYRMAIKSSGNRFNPTFSMIALASMYLHGEGMPRDPARAYMWYNILNTIEGQRGQWSEVLSGLANSMSVDQVNQSQTWALECQQTNFRHCGD